MKSTAAKAAARRPTASADRPGDEGRSRSEPRCYAPPPTPARDDRSGLFTGGATLH
ncbi:MAG: hypothetical protein KKA16_09290 [Alphaproteobacteria bacterium]|nr:hypothetical protein [Alphaproteobacteria bacterium]